MSQLTKVISSIMRNSRRNNFYNRSKTFWTVICFIGCLFQVYELTNIFFSYEVITAVTIRRVTNFTPPALSMCFPIISVMKWEEAFQKFPWIYSTYGYANASMLRKNYSLFKYPVIKWKLESFLINNLTTRQLLDITYSARDLVELCLELYSGRPQLNCE